VDFALYKGNPKGTTLIVSAIERVGAGFGRAPRPVTADRGYSESGIEAKIEGLGTSPVVIPYKGRKSAKRQVLAGSGRRRPERTHHLSHRRA